MDVLIHGLVGLVIVPVYNWIKTALKLKDKAAAWVLLGLCLLIAFPLAWLTNGFSGLVFDPSQPVQFLRAIGQAFLIVLGSAEGLYMLVKKRKEE